MALKIVPKSRLGRKVLAAALAGVIAVSGARAGIAAKKYSDYKRMTAPMEATGFPFPGTGTRAVLLGIYSTGAERALARRMMEKNKAASLPALQKGISQMSSDIGALKKVIEGIDKGKYKDLQDAKFFRGELKKALRAYESLLKDADNECSRKIKGRIKQMKFREEQKNKPEERHLQGERKAIVDAKAGKAGISTKQARGYARYAARRGGGFS